MDLFIREHNHIVNLFLVVHILDTFFGYTLLILDPFKVLQMCGSLGTFLEPYRRSIVISCIRSNNHLLTNWVKHWYEMTIDSLYHVTSSMFCNWNKILYSSDQISGNFLIIVLSFLISYICIQVFYILGTDYPSKCSEWYCMLSQQIMFCVIQNQYK